MKCISILKHNSLAARSRYFAIVMQRHFPGGENHGMRNPDNDYKGDEQSIHDTDYHIVLVLKGGYCCTVNKVDFKGSLSPFLFCHCERQCYRFSLQLRPYPPPPQKKETCWCRGQNKSRHRILVWDGENASGFSDWLVNFRAQLAPDEVKLHGPTQSTWLTFSRTRNTFLFMAKT